VSLSEKDGGAAWKKDEKIGGLIITIEDGSCPLKVVEGASLESQFKKISTHKW